ncbi:MAG: ankyrin repeat domain-containing protein [Verrucomicrobiales bacterium]|nr:ankyrin repeat domain-containing protein [Verrucomicrobiales bacterium]
MKEVLWLFQIGLVLVAGLACGEEKVKETPALKFRYSAKMAREYNAYEGGEFIKEFGDPEGPFAYVGGIVVDAIGVDHYIVKLTGTIIQLHAKKDDNDLLYRVHYFVNEAGHGFGIIQKQSKAEKTKTDAKYLTEENKEIDKRDWKHVKLCQAATLAVGDGNIKLLEALLQAGLQIDEALDFDTKWTALHYASLYNKPGIAKLLIANGADRGVKSRYGDRPIDMAFQKKYWDVCDVMKKPIAKEKLVGEFPEGLLKSLDIFSVSSAKAIQFLSVNKNDPSKEMMTFCRRNWPNVRRGSRAIEASDEEVKVAKSNSAYYDPKTKEFGLVVELMIKMTGKKSYEWSQRQATGPFLSGGGVSGVAVKRYGYWISTTTSSWDE